MAYFYHREQPGSPELTFSTGASSVAHWNSFVSVLKGCLIYGFGDQPPAGWELIAEASNYLVMRAGSHSGYVCLSWSSSAVTISVAETFDGVVDGLIEGDGAKSGVAPGSSIPHKFMVRGFSYSPNNSSWFVIADERTFVLGKAGTDSSSVELVSNNGSLYAQSTIYIGEDSEGNFIACGGRNTTSTGSTAASQAWQEGFTSLRDPGSGLLVDSNALSYHFPGCADRYQTSANSTVSVLDRAYLCPMVWSSGGVIAALRGICMEPRLITSYCSTGAQMLGHIGPLMSGSAHMPIDLGDGFNYVVAPRYSYYGPFFLVTDNPEFWS